MTKEQMAVLLRVLTRLMWVIYHVGHAIWLDEGGSNAFTRAENAIGLAEQDLHRHISNHYTS